MRSPSWVPAARAARTCPPPHAPVCQYGSRAGWSARHEAWQGPSASRGEEGGGGEVIRHVRSCERLGRGRAHSRPMALRGSVVAGRPSNAKRRVSPSTNWRPVIKSRSSRRLSLYDSHADAEFIPIASFAACPEGAKGQRGGPSVSRLAHMGRRGGSGRAATAAFWTQLGAVGRHMGPLPIGCNSAAIRLQLGAIGRGGAPWGPLPISVSGP